MSGITLEALGLSSAELQALLLDRLAEQVMRDVHLDEDGDAHDGPSSFATKLKKTVTAHVEKTIADLAAAHVLPNVAAYVEGLVLQETTKWGEKKGAPLTFVEYLTARAEAYMQELVDYDGKGKAEKDSYNWSGKQTRLTYLIHSHLQYSINTAVSSGLGIGQKAVADAIRATVDAQLANMVTTFKLGVEVKSK